MITDSGVVDYSSDVSGFSALWAVIYNAATGKLTGSQAAIAGEMGATSAMGSQLKLGAGDINAARQVGIDAAKGAPGFLDSLFGSGAGSKTSVVAVILIAAGIFFLVGLGVSHFAK